MMAEQLTFTLPARPALGRADFFTADPNAAALALVDGWQGWPNGKLALIGPKGAGKTHLAHVWAQDTGAVILPATKAQDAPRDARFVVLEDLHLAAGNRTTEEVIFHLHNNLLGDGGRLLMTAATPPSAWPITLPDLASRLQATSVARINNPDDALLLAVLHKLMADRQLSPKTNVTAYLVKNMTRSFAEAARLVTALDRAALTQGRDITRVLAAQVLDELTGSEA